MFQLQIASAVGFSFGWYSFWLVIFGTCWILGSLANRCDTFGSLSK